MSTLETALARVEPHPELVAIQKPAPHQVTEVAALLGWLLPDEDRFRPVPIGERGV